MPRTDHVPRRSMLVPGHLLLGVPGVAAGILLGLSALARLYEHFGLQNADDALEGRSRVLLFAAGQLGLGLALLTGPRRQCTVHIGAVVFAGFAAYTGALAFGDAAGSCGCFGRWSPPAGLMFVVDCAVAASLLGVATGGGTARGGLKWAVPAGLLGCGVAAAPALLFSRMDTGLVPLPGGVVGADASRWVGQTFPMVNLIRGGHTLIERPRCVTLFVSPDCSHCRNLLDSLSKEWRANQGLSPGEFALIWLRPPCNGKSGCVGMGGELLPRQGDGSGHARADRGGAEEWPRDRCGGRA